jgi:hypothetical protein
MAIISKSSSVEKGSETEFTLNISDLLAHPNIAGDAYFSQQSNLDKVIVSYISDVGKQKEILVFENVDSGDTSTASFKVFENARDSFLVNLIILLDKQEGVLLVKRSSLTTEDFDVTF